MRALALTAVAACTYAPIEMVTDGRALVVCAIDEHVDLGTPDPLVDYTDAIQASIDATAVYDATATELRRTCVRLPTHAIGYRVDRTIHIDGRRWLTVGGVEGAPWRQYTNLRGQEAYPHPCHCCVAGGYCPSGAVCPCPGGTCPCGGDGDWWQGTGTDYTGRWVAGQSLRAGWWVESLARDTPLPATGPASEGITLQHIEIRSSQWRRKIDAPGYAQADYGLCDPDVTGPFACPWMSMEAEAGIAIGNTSSRPYVSQIHVTDCRATDTGGDGYTLQTRGLGTREEDIVISRSVSETAGRHGVGVGSVADAVIEHMTVVGAASAAVDLEANHPASELRDIAITDLTADVYRIPILVQGNGQQDIVIDTVYIAGRGYPGPTWYPAIYAGVYTDAHTGAPPTGLLVVRNLSAPGWELSTNGRLISVEHWPEAVIDAGDAELASGTYASGVWLSDVGIATIEDSAWRYAECLYAPPRGNAATIWDEPTIYRADNVWGASGTKRAGTQPPPTLSHTVPSPLVRGEMAAVYGTGLECAATATISGQAQRIRDVTLTRMRLVVDATTPLGSGTIVVARPEYEGAAASLPLPVEVIQ